MRKLAKYFGLLKNRIFKSLEILVPRNTILFCVALLPSDLLWYKIPELLIRLVYGYPMVTLCPGREPKIAGDSDSEMSVSWNSRRWQTR